MSDPKLYFGEKEIFLPEYNYLRNIKNVLKKDELVFLDTNIFMPSICNSKGPVDIEDLMAGTSISDEDLMEFEKDLRLYFTRQEKKLSKIINENDNVIIIDKVYQEIINRAQDNLTYKKIIVSKIFDKKEEEIPLELSHIQFSELNFLTLLKTKQSIQNVQESDDLEFQDYYNGLFNILQDVSDRIKPQKHERYDYADEHILVQGMYHSAVKEKVSNVFSLDWDLLDLMKEAYNDIMDCNKEYSAEPNFNLFSLGLCKDKSFNTKNKYML